MASCDLLHDGQWLMLARLCFTHPTPPSPTSAVRESVAAHLWCRSSSIVPRSTKSASRANGITIDGGGGVSRRSEAGSVSACLGPLRPWAVPQLTGWKVERSAHRAVHDTRLEAGIRVTKRDGGGHENVTVL